MVECINIWQAERMGEWTAQKPQNVSGILLKRCARGVIEMMEENGAEGKQINGKRMEK